MKKANFLILIGLLIGVGVFVSVKPNKSLAAYGSIEIITPRDGTLIDINQDMPVTIFINADPGVFKALYGINSTSPADPHTQIHNWGYPIDYGNLSLPAFKKENLQYACQYHPGASVYFIVDVNQCIDPVDLQPGQTCRNWNAFEDNVVLRCPEPPTCKIDHFSGPSSVSYNGSATLNWSTSNCNSCTASASPYNSYWTGSQSLNGSKTIYNLTQTTSFTLSCSGSYGSDSKTITVSVSQPATCRITNFSANPSSLTGSGNTTLSWSTSNCTSCVASSQPAFGAWTGDVSINGSKTVYLTQTVSFTLYCEGLGPNNYDTRTITVNVNPLPSLNVSCSASPNPAQVGQTVTFTANVSGGISPYSYSWSGAVSGNSSSVSKTFSSAGTYTAYLTVTDNASQSKSTSCSVTINEVPVTRYACNTTTWTCYESPTGTYTSLSACQANCQYTPPPPPPITRYACNTSTWQCYQSSTGPYTSLSACQAECVQPVIRYACNTTTWQCYQSSTGPYTSLNTCQANCVQPANCQITNFTANPNPTSLNGNTVLSWNSSNCNYCTANASPSNSYWLGHKEANGSTIIYNLSQTTTFYLTCYGQRNSDSKSITVNITSVTPLSVSCWATPNPGQINQTITFYSSVSGGSGIYYYNWSGYASGNASSYSRSFPSGGTYWAYLTVNDSQGRTGSASCSVYIEAPQTNYPTLDFWADKYSLILGESTYLRWTSTNTNYCTASNGWSGNKSTGGYESVSPTNQTTYTLTCYGPGGSVTRSLTIYVNAGKNIGITKLGRNLTNGDRTYEKTFRLANGEVAEFYIVVSAINTDLTNVVVKDLLPANFTYINGTTKVNGIIQPDTIVTTGLSLGNIPKGTSKYITFQASGSASGSYLTVTNTAEATADNQTKVTDTANIVFGVVLGAATIKTGPADSIFFLLIVSLGISVSVWYYFTYHPKGKLLFAKIENKIREYRFNQIRKRIIKNGK